MGKTSASHPIRLDWVEGSRLPAGAALGLTFAPGKVDPHAASGPWARSLTDDVQRLSDVHGLDTLVTILEPHELGRLEIVDLPQAVALRGIRSLSLSVVDGSVPRGDELAPWFAALRLVRGQLLAGRRIGVHCRGGLGRTGTFAAALLATFGHSPDESIALVREARPGTVENDAQAAFVAEAARWWEDDLKGRYRGCLLGGAIGDALGAPVEFMGLAEIRVKFGDDGVHEYGNCYGAPGRFTDDTQMTLFTAEGLIRAAVDGVEPVSAVERSLWRWLWTQGEPVPPALASHAGGELFEIDALHAQRAPGNTCLSALRERVAAAASDRSPSRPLNDSKGCGGVMRAAPAGMVDGGPWVLGSATARLTHEHPAGYDTAGLLAEMIHLVLGGQPLAQATRNVWRRRRGQCHADTVRAMDAAFALLQRGAPPTAELVESLGGGWVAEEALAISVYCALVEPDPEAAMALAVTHSGDSDSTGAITGNLLGAQLGTSAWPARWLEPLELQSTLNAMADALFEIR